MASGNFCGLTPQVFCRKLSRMQVPRALAWKRGHKNRQEIRGTALHTSSSAASPKNANKKKKEIRRTASQMSSAALSKSINSVKRAASSLSVKNQKQVKAQTNLEGSPKCTPNFILMVELRKNILTFRDMIDLPSLDASLSVTEIVMQTMKDLQKLSSEIVTINKSFDMKDAEMDKMFIFFYEDLRVIGDSWIMDRDWIERSKYKHSGVGKNKSDRLVEHVLAALDGLIKMLRERFDMMELEYDGKKDFCPKGTSRGRSLTRSESFSDGTNSFFASPVLTPTSVLPGIMTGNSSSPTLWNLRAQALEKLSPADVKRLALHILSQRDEQTLLDLDLKNAIIYEEDASEEADKQKDEEDFTDQSKRGSEDHESERDMETDDQNKLKTSDTYTSESSEANLNLANTSETIHERQEQAISCSSMVSATPLSSPPLPPPLPPPLSMLTKSSPPPPPPPLPPPLSTLTKRSTPPPPPPPLSMLTKGSTSPPPQPPPFPSTDRALSPLRRAPIPPPQPTPTNRAPSLPSPSLPQTKGDGDLMMPPPPPPPGSPAAARSLRAKKATGKLRRSAQIANLYWVLKGKLEGRVVEGKRSKAKKVITGNAPAAAGGKSGMADALAEMTKRSTYFQQIEEDVRKYTKSINELKPAIHSFETKDKKELLEFNCKVESVLEKLTDETQVLARFEGFPQKKLEAIRTAAALYKKLDGILKELKNWKVEPPLNELLDKIERYFNKVKGDIDALERTKDEEAKMFQSHKIHLDFDILVQIKESMVDVSSNCMELALKERREANEAQNEDESRAKSGMTKKPEEAKRLWRAFQFAFKVYTFAGGHDDRADHLTRQLAHEIQSDPQTDSRFKF